jgi:hypothetical protein
MIKIFLSVRNRFGITVKCLEAIKRHTTSPYQIYVYDNQTNFLLDEHFRYFHKLYSKGLVTQVTFNTDESTFNAFSKATSCNMFGLQHEQDPKKKEYSFLVMLDNDIIVTPGWDKYLKRGWKYIKAKKLDYIKVIGQLPGGIKSKIEEHPIADDLMGRAGVLGGSGLWSVRPNFFTDVGLLPLDQLVGHNKKHDQLYWQLLAKVSFGKPYIMGLNKKLGIHCGMMAGSICNVLTRQGLRTKDLSKITFEKGDDEIRSMDFDTFFNKIQNNQQLISDW